MQSPGGESSIITAERLRRFATACLEAVGVGASDAEIVADVLVTADLRGIESHGVARLRRYVDGCASGAIDAAAVPEVVAESAATAVIDAHNGLGQPAARAAMQLAVTKAAEVGVGCVAVRRTNHFGIAGYYAMLPLERGMAGIAMSNASPQVAPTFGATARYGTNPLAFALPTGGEPFVLDMATSVVPRGKLEKMRWHGEPMPRGWAVDPSGAPATDLDAVIPGLKERRGFALMPLGGAGEQFGGHKGFGLGTLVDLMCGPLAGAAWGLHVYADGGANLGQTFLALDVGAFREADVFATDSQRLLEELRGARRADGADRIWTAGEKEAEATRRHIRTGIPLAPPVAADLERLGAAHGIALWT